MQERTKKYLTLCALATSLALYSIEKSLPIVDKNHKLDLNNDGRKDIVIEKGY